MTPTPQQKGTLYLVSTPIGNLKDITLRALETLKNVDLVLVEDTRRARILLNTYDISKPLLSYHDHNKERKTPLLLNKISEGQSVAVVSDAGTPGISDPAFHLVRKAHDASVSVVPIPGATAAISALVVSGLPTDRFVFEGFLPPKKGRRKRLEVLKEERRTIVLYESPHRLLKTLSDLQEFLGDRPAAACRELTKKFEEVLKDSLSNLLNHFSQRKIQGEFVLVVRGRTGKHE